MARARNIKPGFFKNDKLADCGPICMLVFSGLWCIADYRGNLEYRPKRIKIDTIPYFDPEDYGIEGGIEGCIDRLVDTGFVEKYTVNDTEYLHINHFHKHQNPHKNEQDSGSDIPGIEKAQQKTEQGRYDDGSDRADSLNLIPDSLVPNGTGDSGIEPGIDEDKTEPPPPGDKPPKPQPVEFERFWEIYPRKTNKAKAKQAWEKIKPSEELFDLIAENIRARIACGEWAESRKEFIPHGSTYLNQARWEDEVIPRGQSDGPYQQPDKPRSPADRFRAIRAAEGRRDGPPVGADAGDLRPQVGEQLRDSADRRLVHSTGGDHSGHD